MYLSNFGEITNIFDYCNQELEWKELIKLSNELLDINKNHQIKRRNDNLQYLRNSHCITNSYLLTLIIGHVS